MTRKGNSKNFLASALGLNTHKQPVIKVGSQRVSLDFIRHSPSAKSSSPLKKFEKENNNNVSNSNKNGRGMIQQLRNNNNNKTPPTRFHVKQEEIECSPFVPPNRKRPLDATDNNTPFSSSSSSSSNSKSTKQNNTSTKTNSFKIENQQKIPKNIHIQPHTPPTIKQEPLSHYAVCFFPDSYDLYSPLPNDIIDQNHHKKKPPSTSTSPFHSPSNHTNNVNVGDKKSGDIERINTVRSTRGVVVGIGDSQITSSPTIINFIGSQFKDEIIDHTPSSKHDSAKAIKEELLKQPVNLNSQILFEDFEIFQSPTPPPSIGQPLSNYYDNNNNKNNNNINTHTRTHNKSHDEQPLITNNSHTSNTLFPSNLIEEDDEIPSPFLKKEYYSENKKHAQANTTNTKHTYFNEEEEETGSFISSLEKYMLKIEPH